MDMGRGEVRRRSRRKDALLRGHGCHEAASCGEAHHREGERGTLRAENFTLGMRKAARFQ